MYVTEKYIWKVTWPRSPYLCYIYLIRPIYIDTLQAVTGSVLFHCSRNVEVAVKHDWERHNKIYSDYSHGVRNKGPVRQNINIKNCNHTAVKSNWKLPCFSVRFMWQSAKCFQRVRTIPLACSVLLVPMTPTFTVPHLFQNKSLQLFLIIIGYFNLISKMPVPFTHSYFGGGNAYWSRDTDKWYFIYKS